MKKMIEINKNELLNLQNESDNQKSEILKIEKVMNEVKSLFGNVI